MSQVDTANFGPAHKICVITGQVSKYLRSVSYRGKTMCHDKPHSGWQALYNMVVQLLKAQACIAQGWLVGTGHWALT